MAYARGAVSGPPPFKLVSAAMSHDYAHFLAALDDGGTRESSAKP
jgi:hypothetical protein